MLELNSLFVAQVTRSCRSTSSLKDDLNGKASSSFLPSTSDLTLGPGLRQSLALFQRIKAPALFHAPTA